MFKKLKWLSIENILENLKKLFQRFPLVAVDTLVATICANILIESSDWNLTQSTQDILTKVLLMAVLGFPLLTAATLISERFKWKSLYHWPFQVLGIFLLVIYYFVLPSSPENFQVVESSRLFVFNIVAYLFALSIPFYEKGNSVRFWRFVEFAFARLVVSAFFTLTLWAGISLSLAAIDYLFGVNIEGNTYARVGLLLTGIFGAWFFLSGFPKVDEHIPEAAEKSKVLRVFIQYICVPLLSIFFVILYAYLGKIVVLWDWPKGGVADWILGFSSAGFFVYILAYPLIQKNDIPFLKKFFQIFFALVLPMVAVLALAIYFRVSEYGVTESRYLVMIGGIWLLISAVYFLLSKEKELKLLPYLAATFLFLAVWGPWSMYSVSVRSQYARLEGMLTEYKLLQNGKAMKVADENTIPIKDRASIYSKIQFLAEHQKEGKIYDWFEEVSSTTESRKYAYDFTSRALESINIKNYYDTSVNFDQDYAYIGGHVSGVTNVSGFDSYIGTVYLYPSNENGGEEYTVPYIDATVSTTYRFRLSDNQIKVLKNNTETASIDLTPYLSGWREKFAMTPVKEMKIESPQVEVDSSTERYRFLITDLSLQKENGNWKVRSGNMNVLIDLK